VRRGRGWRGGGGLLGEDLFPIFLSCLRLSLPFFGGDNLLRVWDGNMVYMLTD
jgi:hypothetical protein